ncbi:MAG: hypothetical protein VCE75_06475 [Alphaproteobacteria bacterium]
MGDGVIRVDEAIFARVNLKSSRLGGAFGPHTDLRWENLWYANLVKVNLAG